MAGNGLADDLKGRTIVIAVHALAWLPFRIAQLLGRAIGWLHWTVGSPTARVTRTNLELCFPGEARRSRERMARASLMHTGQALMETPGIWLTSQERNLARIRRVEGGELLDAALAAGSGVILMLPHLGNWELVNHYLGAGPRMTALYQPPRLRAVHDLIRDVRDRAGNLVVPPTRQGLTQLYRTLEEGGIVVVLPDQVPASGEFAPFFGVTALTDLLVPRLVRRTGAAVLCVFVPRLPGGRGFEVIYRPAQDAIGDPDPRVAAAAVNASIEACVREYPEQYQWEYKRFKERPPGEPRLYRRQ